MENDHPRSMDFLRMDCRNVTTFFKRKGAHPATARSLFSFVMDSDLKEEDQEDRLKVGTLPGALLPSFHWVLFPMSCLLVVPLW